MNPREEFVCEIERKLKKPRLEIQKLYPKMPRAAYYLIDQKIKLPDKIFEFTETFPRLPEGYQREAETRARFFWNGLNGNVLIEFYKDMAILCYEPESRHRKRLTIQTPYDLSGLRRLLHWRNCEFVHRRWVFNYTDWHRHDEENMRVYEVDF